MAQETARIKREGGKFRTPVSSDGVGAILAATALEAGFAEVEFVNPLDEGSEVGLLVGEDAGLEVALGRALGTHARSREVGRGDEGGFAIDDDGLGVDAGAENTLEEFALQECGIAVKVFTEAGARLLGMKEADGDSSLDEVGKDGQERDVAAPLLDVQVFEVSGDDPEETLSLGDQLLDHAVVDLLVEEEFGHLEPIA